VSPEYNGDSAKYVADQWGVSFRTENDGENILGVVVRDYPEIMSRVEESGYFQTELPTWQVSRISQEGVTFYLVNDSGKTEDGRHRLWEEVFVFLPMNNVIAIHNVSKQFFINESLRAMERKEKPATGS
jgi:hypothetical protein